MDEVNIMCEMAVMYAVACGVCFLRDGIERLWAGMQKLVSNHIANGQGMGCML